MKGRLFLCAAALTLAGPALAQPSPGPEPTPEQQAEFDARLSAHNAKRREIPYADYEGRAAALAERAAMFAAHYGENSRKHAEALQLLGAEHVLAKRPERAVEPYRQALAIHRAQREPDDEWVLYAAHSLATSLERAGRPAEAIAALSEVLAEPDADWTARYADPGERLRLAHRVENQAMGRVRALHARLILAHGGDAAAAATSARLAAAASDATRAGFGTGSSDEALLDSYMRDPRFSTGEEAFGEWARLSTDAAWTAGSRDPGTRARVLATLQDATAGLTTSSLARAAARAVANRSGAGALVERRDALATRIAAELQRWDETRATLSAAEQDAIFAGIRGLEAQREEADRALAAAAPGYFALIRPRPLDLAATQALLAPDEAALLVVPTEFGTHVMVIDRDGLDWHRADLPEDKLNDRVRRLLWDVGGNVEVSADENARWSAEGQGPYPFDRGTAHALYKDLVAPFAQRLAGRRHVYVAASGALATLPFALLVAEPPQGADGDAAALRGTAWLGERFALLQLPSLQSLQLIRAAAAAKGGDGGRLLGFGDPVLAGEAETRGTGPGRRATRSAGMAFGQAWSPPDGGGAPLADVASLRRLARLPGTARELEALRTAFGPAQSRIVLAEAATEAAFKTAPLTGLDVLALATHGLLAGEASGLYEPGLVFTPPRAPSARDDGLLSAAEIAELRIDADWVVLSACNTAAGDGTFGSPGLSGLARAFLFAGARSLLVSHWPVKDAVAEKMTVRTVELERTNPGWSRAQALQAAMREIRDDPSGDADLETWARIPAPGRRSP